MPCRISRAAREHLHRRHREAEGAGQVMISTAMACNRAVCQSAAPASAQPRKVSKARLWTTGA